MTNRSRAGVSMLFVLARRTPETDDEPASLFEYDEAGGAISTGAHTRRQAVLTAEAIPYSSIHYIRFS
jgi:hypothetical protein